MGWDEQGLPYGWDCFEGGADIVEVVVADTVGRHDVNSIAQWTQQYSFA